jgi:hypothetical protein
MLWGSNIPSDDGACSVGALRSPTRPRFILVLALRRLLGRSIEGD